MKRPIVVEPDYTFYFEDFWLGPIVHLDIHTRWTKTLKAEVRAVVDALVERHGPLYVAHFPEQGEKMRKFLKAMGFEFFCYFLRMNGEKIPFYIRVR